MEEYRAVELIKDNNFLFEKGIKKGCVGVILENSQNNQYIVLFFNPMNVGEYAIGLANKSDVKTLGEIPDKYKAEIASMVKNSKIFNSVSFKESLVKEHDLVELIADRAVYSKHGIYKGMQGCVIGKFAFKGKWEITFSEEGTGKDIASILIKEEDFKVIE
ncbi:MAG: hypothetical protein FWH03_01160 [Firmicutes bacterium]|nr:hypothetical protein [Bacillota bacterium]